LSHRVARSQPYQSQSRFFPAGHSPEFPSPLSPYPPHNCVRPLFACRRSRPQNPYCPDFTSCIQGPLVVARPPHVNCCVAARAFFGHRPEKNVGRSVAVQPSQNRPSALPRHQSPHGTAICRVMSSASAARAAALYFANIFCRGTSLFPGVSTRTPRHVPAGYPAEGRPGHRY